MRGLLWAFLSVGVVMSTTDAADPPAKATKVKYTQYDPATGKALFTKEGEELAIKAPYTTTARLELLDAKTGKVEHVYEGVPTLQIRTGKAWHVPRSVGEIRIVQLRAGDRVTVDGKARKVSEDAKPITNSGQWQLRVAPLPDGK